MFLIHDTFGSITPLQIYNIPVTPVMNKLNVVGGSYERGLNTHLNYAAQLFAYWRGSMCYKFNFYTSPFVSYRVQLSFSSRSAYASGIGELYRREETYSGSGEIDFVVPFVSDDDWISTGSTTLPGAPNTIVSGVTTTGTVPGYNGMLTFTLDFLNCAMGDRDKTIYTVVTGRGGQDMQFRRPYPYRKGTSQMRVSENAYSTEITEGNDYYKRYAVEEDSLCLEDFARKWSRKQIPIFQLPYRYIWDPNEFSLPNYYDISMYSYISSMFQYMRGGAEFKFVYADVNPDDTQFYISFLDNSCDISSTLAFNNVTNGAVGRVKDTNPVLDGEFHFEAPQEWFRTFFVNSPAPQRPCLLFLEPVPLGPVTFYSRCTKDTQFSYLLPPPITMYMPWYLGAGA